MANKIIKKDSILFHGSSNNFPPKDIKSPFWLSKYKDQAINHVCYKYKNINYGYLYTYKITKNLVLIDITKDGDSRLIINAKGNYYLANKIKDENNKDIDGYINLPEQGEIMLIDNINILSIKKETFKIDKDISYKNTNTNNWRMVDKNRTCCIIS